MKYFLFIFAITAFVSCSNSSTESAKKCNTSEECGTNYYCSTNICFKSTCIAENKDANGNLCSDTEKCNIYTGQCDVVVECDVNSLPVKTDETCGLNNNGIIYKNCEGGRYKLQCVDFDICLNNEILITVCGIDNIGEQTQRCLNGQWVNEGECIIQTPCIENDTRIIPCGENGEGIQNQICTSGEWNNDGDCFIEPACTENDTKTVSCGLNGNGNQKKICVSEEWINDGECVDDDICVNDTTEPAVCDNFNNDGDGTKTRTCINGQWGTFGDCVDPDICGNNSTESAQCDILNGDNNGTIIHTCIDGQWGEWSECNDPDVCINGDNSTLTCDNFNNDDDGLQTRTCTNGQWGAYSNCVDPDICENENTTSQSCGLNGNGRQPLICIDGQWDENGACVDPDVCVNNNLRDDVTSCGYNGNGLQREICTEGQWEKYVNCEPGELNCHDGCLDPDECENATLGNIQCSFEQTNSSYTAFCIDGQWNCSVFAKSEGTTLTDIAHGVTVDGNGNIYVTGITYGNFDGIPNSNGNCTADLEECAEAFLVKYSPYGVKLWSKLIGKPGYDMGVRVTTDTDKNVYVTGNTKTNLAGTNKGLTDIFVIKYSPDGEYLWGLQEGTSQDDNVGGFLINGPKIYLVGSTNGAFAGQSNYGGSDAILIKFQNIDVATASAEYFRQFGTSNNDVATSVTKTGSGGSVIIYIGGFTEGLFTGNTDDAARDMFLASYAANGTQRFVKQWGTGADDRINSLTVDSSGIIYAAGSTMGSFTETITRDNSDSFVSKVTPRTTAGNTTVNWSKQYNSVGNGADYGNSITSDGTYLYLAGDTNSNITASTSHYGANDIFMLKLDNNGVVQNSKQWGSAISDAGYEIIYKTNYLYVIGQTTGDLYENENSTQPAAWVSDMFLIRWKE